MAIPISLYYSSQVWGSLGWLNGLADLKENWSRSKRVYFLYSKLSRSVSTSTNSADELQIPSRQTFFVCAVLSARSLLELWTANRTIDTLIGLKIRGGGGGQSVLYMRTKSCFQCDIEVGANFIVCLFSLIQLSNSQLSLTHNIINTYR